MGLISNGTTIFDAGALDSGLAKGAMTFIKKLTASGSATLSFVHGSSGVVLDDTYKEYVFTFKNIHPATDNGVFSFNMSIDTGSNYNVTKTTTVFRTYHSEDNSAQALTYQGNEDLAQSTALQHLAYQGNANDECMGGTLQLFNPSSTTFVKHFIYRGQFVQYQDSCQQWFVSGYGNTTSAVDAILFKYESGNIDAGDICLYGIA
jgi:hypothetical protein